MWKLTLVSFSILCAKYPITNNQVSVFIITSFASYRRVVEKRPPLEFYSMSLYSKVTLRTTEMQQRATLGMIERSWIKECNIQSCEGVGYPGLQLPPTQPCSLNPGKHTDPGLQLPPTHPCSLNPGKCRFSAANVGEMISRL